jgi:cyclopropane fatty-acyl-phospholipid synthase-like methyltransferase
MGAWNELLAGKVFKKQYTEPPAHRLVQILEETFKERPLLLWDLCCGAGRHTVMFAKAGHKAYASDLSETGIRLTNEWLARERLSAEVERADMTQCPWPEVKFHGVLSWDALHHNTRANMQKAIDMVRGHLVPKGVFMLTLKSRKAESYGKGKKIEPNTYIVPDGVEKGIAHHYLDEKEIREMFADWRILYLVENVMRYSEKSDEVMSPFHYSKWNVLVQKI